MLGAWARNPTLTRAFHNEFVCKRVLTEMIGDAVHRGRVSAEVPNDEVDDVLASYPAFRSLTSADSSNQHTDCALIEQVLFASLIRDRGT